MARYMSPTMYIISDVMTMPNFSYKIPSHTIILFYIKKTKITHERYDQYAIT